MRRDFVVSVRQENRPIAGVAIELYTSDQNGEATLLLSGKSKADGTFVVAHLRPGDYWLGVTFLGVRAAGSDCFYVPNRPSRKAKQALTYSWGDNPLVVSQLAGRLVERQPPRTDNNPASMPITKARLTLRNATGGPAYTTMSKEDGGFAFDSVPSGTYVLEVEYENEPNLELRADHVVIRIDRKAEGGPISLTRMHSGDGTYLVPSKILPNSGL